MLASALSLKAPSNVLRRRHQVPATRHCCRRRWAGRCGDALRGHGWDPKGPASIHRTRAALDKDGAVIGYVFESKGLSRIDIDTNESDPSYSLAARISPTVFPPPAAPP